MKLQKDRELKARDISRDSRSHIAIGIGTGIAVAAAAAILVFRGCETKVEGPMAIRADGVCVGDVEGYPFKRDIRTGKPLLDANGKPVANPYYSKEDCFRGDGKCDVARDKTKLEDPTGALVPDFKDAYTDKNGNKTPIVLPLEDQNSVDCVMVKLAEQPCGAVDPTHPVLERPAFVLSEMTILDVKIFTNANLRKRLRTQTEVEDLYNHPDIYQKEGGDLYTVVVDYKETCEASLPDCTPLSFDACHCENLLECQESPCGKNGIEKEKGEECDISSDKKLGGCKVGSHCLGCKCVKNEAKPTCNNGIFDRGREQCDASSTLERGGCSEGQHCVSCQCIPNEEPECPSTLTKCEGVKPGQIGARMLRAVNEGDLRQKCSGDIQLSGEFRVTPSGVPTQIDTISATCDGSDMGISGKKADLTGVTVGAPGGECDCSLKVSPPVSKAGTSG